ncbi:AMIN domain-containing protein [Cyanobacteria bacterium FACHB-63]|nr:AMIN domain-containing protein [Cyanobacteria bacterium FACHB-63]
MLKFFKLELTAAIALLISTPAIAAPLENWRFDPNTNQLEVTVPAGITPRYSLMAQPTRLVLDLPDTQVADVNPRGTFSGAVREVQVSQFQPNIARIVLELAPDTELSNPQAQLQLVKSTEQGQSRSTSASVRWTLRPMLAASTNSKAVFNAVRLTQAAPVQTSAPQTAIAQTSAPASPIAQASANDFGLPPAPPAINVAPETPPSVTAPPLPPAQSRPLPAAPTAGSSNQPGSSLLFPTAPARSFPQSNPLQLPEVNSSLEIPRSFPPVIAPAIQPEVTVPQLERRSDPPRSTQRPLEEAPVPARSRVIEFGQPLPR